MATRVGINGFGRIGRAFVRRSLTSRRPRGRRRQRHHRCATLAHLLEFDSTYGRWRPPVSHTDDSIVVDGRPIAVTAQP